MVLVVGIGGGVAGVCMRFLIVEVLEGEERGGMRSCEIGRRGLGVGGYIGGKRDYRKGGRRPGMGDCGLDGGFGFGSFLPNRPYSDQVSGQVAFSALIKVERGTWIARSLYEN